MNETNTATGMNELDMIELCYELYAENKRAIQELSRMLKLIYPEIVPLETLSGVISQIDNGFAVPLRDGDIAKLQAENERLRAALEAISEYNHASREPAAIARKALSGDK